MSQLVADTSALVSLGVVAGGAPDPLAFCLARYEVPVPIAVIDALREIASYDDAHGRAATVVLDRTDAFDIETVALDAEFLLDDGESAADTLPNECTVELLLCDEFNQLGLIDASLADTRLVTTPTLLWVLVRTDQLSVDEARALIEEISAARSWSANSYVQRARSLLEKD